MRCFASACPFLAEDDTNTGFERRFIGMKTLVAVDAKQRTVDRDRAFCFVLLASGSVIKGSVPEGKCVNIGGDRCPI